MSRILDRALEDVDQLSTATGMIPLHLRQYQHHDHPYLTPFQPHHAKAWPHFSSIVKMPQRWHVSSSGHLVKTTKIPLKYRQPIQLKKPLPKGWVYDEDAKVAKAEELVNLSLYKLTHPRLTCAQHQLEDHRH